MAVFAAILVLGLLIQFSAEGKQPAHRRSAGHYTYVPLAGRHGRYGELQKTGRELISYKLRYMYMHRNIWWCAHRAWIFTWSIHTCMTAWRCITDLMRTVKATSMYITSYCLLSDNLSVQHRTVILRMILSTTRKLAYWSYTGSHNQIHQTLNSGGDLFLKTCVVYFPILNIASAQHILVLTTLHIWNLFA